MPEHIRLTSYQIERLEIIRTALNVSESEFYFHIRTHPECTKMLQRQQYERARVSAPGMPDEFYLMLVVLQRLEAARVAGGDVFGLRGKFPDSVSSEDPGLVAAVIEIIRSHGWRTIEDLAAGIVEDEATLPEIFVPHPSTEEARRQITLILRESAPRP